jgi:hypothetical protein
MGSCARGRARPSPCGARLVELERERDRAALGSRADELQARAWPRREAGASPLDGTVSDSSFQREKRSRGCRRIPPAVTAHLNEQVCLTDRDVIERDLTERSPTMKGTRDGRKVDEERAIAPVTIFDGAGRVVRVVPAEEFQRAAAAAREAAASRAPDDAQMPLGRTMRPLRYQR